MSWHTKYRPRAASELHLTEVRTVLLQLMKSGSFPQVFLCAGPKGTGKTSTSRIIGAMLNDPANEKAVKALFFDTDSKGKAELTEPDSQAPLAEKIFSGQSFIVQEMDAASNRGIDDVRQLKERVSLPPQEGLMSVYILDEVHMLTKEAFNALLKLLEEPPQHAVFILATTELHKVPDTIQSRCAMLPFRKATEEELITALQKVIKAEKISIDDQAVAAVATHAGGSFRDAIKHLEMVVTAHDGSDSITVEHVQSILQTGFAEYIPKLISAVVGKDEQQVVSLFETLRSQGVASAVLHSAVVDYLHKELLIAISEGDAQAAFNQRVCHFLLSEIKDIPTIAVEPMPLLSLELKLLEIIYRAQDRSGSSSGGTRSSRSSSSADKSSTASGTSVKTAKKPVQTAADEYEAYIDQIGDFEEEVAPIEDSELGYAIRAPKLDPISAIKKASKVKVAVDLKVHQNIEVPDHVDTRPLLEAWADFVKSVETNNSTLAAVLRSAKPLPEKSNGIAKVEVYYSFHRDQLMQPKFMSVLQDCAESFIGGRPGFEFILGDATIKETNPADEQGATIDTNLAAIADSILM
jgi:DNA polymerase III subunit gamma/tau